MSHITFNEAVHTYTSTEGVLYTPTSTFLKQFYAPFDSEMMSMYKAIQKYYGDVRFNKAKKAYGWENVVNTFLTKAPESVIAECSILAAELINEWEVKATTACLRGTQYHLEQEVYVQENGFKHNGVHYKYRDFKFGDVLSKDESFVTTELMMWNDGLTLAGTADLVVYDKGRWIVLDYKTNETLERNNFNKMLGIFSNLNDDSIGHYTVQLNLYMGMLKAHYNNTTTGGCYILHKKYGSYERITCADVQTQVARLITNVK